MRAKLVSSQLVFDHSRLGHSVLGDLNDTTYQDLLFDTKSNINDAMIGEAAKREGCILITDDKRFIVKLNKANIPNMTFDEFKESIV